MTHFSKGSASGRGARSNRDGRFERFAHEAADDDWDLPMGQEFEMRDRTSVTPDTAKTVIARNSSPDVPFDQSINPYRGCEHGCVYCFARPRHAYLGLSPGLDFETRLFAKFDAVELLTNELAKRNYQCRTLQLGANTDPYQPVERRLRITRGILEVLGQARHPVSINTKSDLVCRDLDLLAPMAADNVAAIAVSVTTLALALARRMEPRAPTPQKRLDAARRLTDAGVPVAVLAAPMIPALNDHELQPILEAARDSGATGAGYVLLRLPHELGGLFEEWL
ncbi:MAG: PA0069 family radical SAM protein [Rhodospirillaceae bacterium]